MKQWQREWDKEIGIGNKLGNLKKLLINGLTLTLIT